MKKVSIAITSLLLLATLSLAAPNKSKPNVVIIFTDDQGYQDVGVFGAEGFKTPHLDKMAKEGVQFTHWYAAQPVCSASRTALLTGCYPNRVGIHGALGPKNTHGINSSETTLPELFKSKGYATGMFGKWHLGHHPEFLPTRHGFDEFFGIPYSNDMWPNHPEAGDRFPPLPLIEGEKTIHYLNDQSQLTTMLTDRAVHFINNHKNDPFFLYVPHPQPHVPLFVSDKFKGKSELGLYGDVMMELDWSVGEILKAIKRNGLDDNTLVIFTSDNGPWLSYGDHSGRAKPLREGKGTVWEGGVREPMIMRWPGVLPAGKVQDTPAMNIDILPTIADLIGAELPKHQIDGKNIWPLITCQTGAKNPQEAYYFYYKQNELQAVLSGKWKLILPHRFRTLAGNPGGKGGIPVKYSNTDSALELYNLSDDIGEKTDLASRYPEVVKRLQKYANKARQDLGDKLTKTKGKGVRPAGTLDH
ncbi:sulfatase [bacterium]|nr:sulfatase [bacterium]